MKKSIIASLSLLVLVLIFFNMNNQTDDLKRDEINLSNKISCGGTLWNIQEDITPIDNYQVIITKHACTKGGEYIDGQFYEDDKPSKPYPGMEGYSYSCLLYTSPSPRDQRGSRMPSSA